ncbi:hypothetical protein GCM10023085_46180 [Actinomadura viridis]|uniref:Transcriptional regulator with XRE-family HTH domain n=1 Tax=Actinomadura viridis TaxID=58110 RepID=A0A931DNQ3_9ACTN|nr:helix-turn-helix transcriptional regulator [Actinomadura viridis]MBG6089978.1 transcriptional regulator with XRE-family HTH domain [Actinomadura viridis]
MSSETALSRWLQKEMPRQGYPLVGHKAGGITRLAEAAGIPQASMSRLVNGRVEPSIDNLRKIGRVLGYQLSDMLVHAGLATREEVTSTGTPDPNPDIPSEISVEDLPEGERQIWEVRGLTREERALAAHMVRIVRSYRNGTEPPPGIDESIDALTGVLGEMMKRNVTRPSRLRRVE